MLHIMGHDQNGFPVFLIHIHKQLHHITGTLRIQSGCRLIQHQHIRIHGKDSCDGNSSLLPAG